MEINIFIAIAIFVAFFIGVFTYRLGIKDGLLVKKEKPISSINPIKQVYGTFKDIKEESKADKSEKEFNDSIDEILSYDGQPKG